MRGANALWLLLGCVLASAAVGLASAHAAAPQTDARVRAISEPPLKLGPGSRMRLFVRVRAPRASTLRLRLSLDKNVDATDLPMGMPRRIPQGTRSVFVDARVAFATSKGWYRVVVCLRRVGARGTGHCRSSRLFAVDPVLPPVEPPNAIEAPAPAAPAAPTPVLPPPVVPRSPVPLGTAIWWGCVDEEFSGPDALVCKSAYDPRYESAARRFDAFVPENELKELWIRPAAGVWDFRVPDRLVAWAQEQGKPVRGHVLIFGDAIPGWRFRDAEANPVTWTRDELLAELRTHVATVMAHYRGAFPGVIDEWDVVNEAFEDSGEMDTNLYRQVIGPDYVEQAFLAARAADPTARLFYNEYNADRPGTPRAEAVYRMVSDFRDRGVPIDGVGLQMHVGTGGNAPTPPELAAQIARYADLGVDVEFTETDVGVTPTPAGLDPLAQQSDVYRGLGATCFVAPTCRRMMVWGVADPYSWRGLLERPLLIDEAFAEKPAWAALKAALRGDG